MENTRQGSPWRNTDYPMSVWPRRTQDRHQAVSAAGWGFSFTPQSQRSRYARTRFHDSNRRDRPEETKVPGHEPAKAAQKSAAREAPSGHSRGARRSRLRGIASRRRTQWYFLQPVEHPHTLQRMGWLPMA